MNHGHTTTPSLLGPKGKAFKQGFSTNAALKDTVASCQGRQLATAEIARINIPPYMWKPRCSIHRLRTQPKHPAKLLLALLSVMLLRGCSAAQGQLQLLHCEVAGELQVPLQPWQQILEGGPAFNTHSHLVMLTTSVPKGVYTFRLSCLLAYSASAHHCLFGVHNRLHVLSA